jgi:hypothetical protein
MKIIVTRPNERHDAYIQINSWSRPSGGPWFPIKDKEGAIIAWRHYFKDQRVCFEQTGIYPPPAPSFSLDGGFTWNQDKNQDEIEEQWISSMKNDIYTRWHIRREGDKLLARKSK